MKLLIKQSKTFTANTRAGSLCTAYSVTYSDHIDLLDRVNEALQSLANLFLSLLLRFDSPAYRSSQGVIIWIF